MITRLATSDLINENKTHCNVVMWLRIVFHVANIDSYIQTWCPILLLLHHTFTCNIREYHTTSILWEKIPQGCHSDRRTDTFVTSDKALVCDIREYLSIFKNIQRICQLCLIVNVHVWPSVHLSRRYMTSFLLCPSCMTTLGSPEIIHNPNSVYWIVHLDKSILISQYFLLCKYLLW